MALHKKYADLPDLDSAPDIYETPELDDSNSTIPPTTVQSPSDNELDEDEFDDSTGISRSRLRVNDARSRFLPATVDASDVDFSDRVSSKRKSYKASSRRPRIWDDRTQEYGDLSDEDEAEHLARKIARLKREIEEAKEEYGKQEYAKKTTTTGVKEGEITSLSQALHDVSKLVEDSAPKYGAPTTTSGATAAAETSDASTGGSATYTITYAPGYEQTHALAKAADFDRRLVLLEKALGVGSSVMAGLEADGLPRAVMPMLDTLQRQIATLSDASTSSLDSISRRMRALTQEAENLEKARRGAKAAQDALASTGAAPAAAGGAVDPEVSEQTAKINALYGMLPTVERLAPLLPPLLDRLRSLRAVHSDAATASQTLERIEKRQADMAVEINQWKDGLEEVEEVMKKGEASMTDNLEVMEGWVRDLEIKMAPLKMS